MDFKKLFIKLIEEEFTEEEIKNLFITQLHEVLNEELNQKGCGDVINS